MSLAREELCNALIFATLRLGLGGALASDVWPWHCYASANFDLGFRKLPGKVEIVMLELQGCQYILPHLWVIEPWEVRGEVDSRTAPITRKGTWVPSNVRRVSGTVSVGIKRGSAVAVLALRLRRWTEIIRGTFAMTVILNTGGVLCFVTTSIEEAFDVPLAILQSLHACES
jgi:hypothetical protein